MKIIFLTLLVMAAGCTPIGVKISGPINRIGVVVNVNSDVICYNYTGFTVFQNSTNPYKFPSGFKFLVQDSLSKSFSSHNVETIIIDPSEISKFEGFTKTSTWDGAQSILEEYLIPIKKISKENRLDAIIILDYLTSKNKDRKCAGVASLNSTDYGIFLSPPAFGVYTPEGMFSKNMYLYTKVNGAARMHHPKVLDEYYLKYLEGLMSKTIESEVYNLLFPKP